MTRGCPTDHSVIRAARDAREPGRARKDIGTPWGLNRPTDRHAVDITGNSNMQSGRRPPRGPAARPRCRRRCRGCRPGRTRPSPDPAGHGLSGWCPASIASMPAANRTGARVRTGTLSRIRGATSGRTCTDARYRTARNALDFLRRQNDPAVRRRRRVLACACTESTASVSSPA